MRHKEVGTLACNKRVAGSKQVLELGSKQVLELGSKQVLERGSKRELERGSKQVPERDSRLEPEPGNTERVPEEGNKECSTEQVDKGRDNKLLLSSCGT